MYHTCTESIDLKRETFEKKIQLMTQSQEKCAGQGQSRGGLETVRRAEEKNKYRTKKYKDFLFFTGRK
jgi:hypothetical protein